MIKHLLLGHEVLYTPPRYSDFQPIELVWTAVKGEVGRQYTTQTSFTDVHTRLVTAFDNLRSSTVEGCIQNSLQHLHASFNYIMEEEKDSSEEEEAEDGVASEVDDDSPNTNYDSSERAASRPPYTEESIMSRRDDESSLSETSEEGDWSSPASSDDD